MGTIPAYLHNLESIQENGISKKFRYSIDVRIYFIKGTRYFKPLKRNGRF